MTSSISLPWSISFPWSLFLSFSLSFAFCPLCLAQSVSQILYQFFFILECFRPWILIYYFSFTPYLPFSVSLALIHFQAWSLFVYFSVVSSLSFPLYKQSFTDFSAYSFSSSLYFLFLSTSRIICFSVPTLYHYIYSIIPFKNPQQLQIIVKKANTIAQFLAVHCAESAINAF